MHATYQDSNTRCVTKQDAKFSVPQGPRTHGPGDLRTRDPWTWKCIHIVMYKLLDWNSLWNGLSNFVYNRWHLCSSCFCPFPLCQTSEETPLLQVRCNCIHWTYYICTWPLTPKTSRRMHERRPNARQSWLWVGYQVGSYTAELGIAMEKWFRRFL